MPDSISLTARLSEAAPTESKLTGVLFEEDIETNDGALAIDVAPRKMAGKRQYQLVWHNIMFLSAMHVGGLYGIWLTCTAAKWQTILFAYFLYVSGLVGITAGAHRLWSHRSYKAKWPLRAILVVLGTMAFQGSSYQWARDHRVHHKYSDTDADPHNATRGFFYSHMGWLMCRKHPDTVASGYKIDISDLHADRVLMFQKKYYLLFLMPLFFFILPTAIPMYFWNESFVSACFVACMFRWLIQSHATMSINSVAHMFGNRPYDKAINPSETLFVSVVCVGEGWHNYHHVFPWDYKAGEWGKYSTNLTVAFINFFAKIGWAYDLKTVAPETIKKRVMRTGDGTHEYWGWGDKDIKKEDKQDILIIKKN